MGKSWDTKKVNDFIEYLEHAASNYMDCLCDVHQCYEDYINNETFVGQAADSTKTFIALKQKEFNRQQYDLSKEIVKRYIDLDETFKAIVDPAADAKINTDVVSNVKTHFMNQYDYLERIGCGVQQKTIEAVDRLGKYGCGLEEINFKNTIMQYYDHCGTGGFLDNCIKKVEEFDDTASTRVFNSGIRNAIQEHIEEVSDTSAGLDMIHTQAVDINKQTLSLVSLSAAAVKTVTSTVSKNTNLTKNNKNAWIYAMREQYGFTYEEALLLEDSYNKFETWVKNNEKEAGILYTNQEKIKIFFGYLSALNPDYSNIDPTFKMVNATSTNNSIIILKEMGADADKLKEMLIKQHSNCGDLKKRDFLHECAMYSLMSNSFYNTGSKIAFGHDLYDYIGYKGDVYSGSMGIDDKLSDVAAVGIYSRMLNCEDGNIFHAIGEYCIGESNGTINSTDEFLKFYGNGDADKGMAVIKKRLDKENYLTRKIANSKNASDEAIEKTKKEFIDYLEKERSE